MLIEKCGGRKKNMNRLTKHQYDDFTFFRGYNLLPKDVSENLVSDIDWQIKNNLCTEPNVPLYQTWPNMQEVYFNNTNWQDLFRKTIELIHQINPKLKMIKCWANVSKNDSKFEVHQHTTAVTAVYYLRNKYSFLGTLINDEIIVPGIENSILIFDGKVPHTIVNSTNDQVHNRYSIAMDFNMYN